MAMCVQLFFVLCFAFTVGSEILDHRFFLGQIIEKYGHNGTITYEGFERLCQNLGVGGHSELEDTASPTNLTTEKAPSLSRPNRHIDSSQTSKEHEELENLVNSHDEVPPGSTSLAAGTQIPTPRCLSPREMLVVYGLGQAGSLSPVSFLHLCPAIVYQLDQHTCGWEGGREHHHAAALRTTQASWFYATLTILVISVSGLLSVGLVPLLQKSFFHQLITFLVALAVGTLLGDAFLHLIPHALESHGGGEHGEHGGHTDSLMKSGVLFLTIVFFFSFEAILNTLRSKKDTNKLQENMNYVSVNLNPDEKEMMEMNKEMLEMNKEMLEVNGNHSHHHHHHSHGGPQSNTALMVIMGDGLHNLTDGLAIGAAFSGGLAPGFATGVAVFTHELPHELGDFAVLLKAGMSVRKALFYNFISSILSLLGTIIGLVIGNFGDSTSWIYAITAGSFIYIALSNLVPEINKQKSDLTTIILQLCGILSGGAIMGCIALFEHDIQHLFS